jgi:hypothetical protein
MRFLIMAIISTVLAFLLGEQLGLQEGIKEGTKAALKIDPNNHELEITCLSMWVGEQNKEAVRRGLDK